MDLLRSASVNGEDNGGIPEDLRCKRSDGKQWRCTAMSMPDKTVCEKHYIQAKKRAANSALRASLKKANRNPYDDSDVYLDSRNDELDTLSMDTKGGEFSASASGSMYKDNFLRNQARYSPETPPTRSLSARSPINLNDDGLTDFAEFDENRKSSYRTPPHSSMESLRNKTNPNFDTSPLACSQDHSDESMDSSDAEVGLTCHQCQRIDNDRVIWCLKCDKRGYCDSCVLKWYPEISMEEIQKVCPACRGCCNCKLCLHGDNLIKCRIRDIAVAEKLRYFHCLLSSILPVVKQIHSEQCFELELETKLHGTKADIPRAKLHADEKMCCNCCRMPIVDYHRHCAKCLYDLCLSCCRDLRQVSQDVVKGESAESQASESCQDMQPRLTERRMNIAKQCPDWKANSDGSVPCPPKVAGGCGCSSLLLRRILKMNWVAKLVKNVEEMVDGCKVYNMDSPWPSGLSDEKLCQFAHREDSNDNYLYCPVSQDIKVEGIYYFQKHWARGEPVIIKQVCDCVSSSNWDPMAIWRGIRETTDEKMKDDNRTVKAIDYLDGSEVDIELGLFIKGYTEGRTHENGWPEMLKLKDWPSPSASEEFLLYQRPDFLSKLPLIEYIHSKWGLLNVAAKLPHYSLQNDVGPKIYMTYGTYGELGRGDSLTNLHTNMRDMVYLLMHSFEVKLKCTKVEELQKTLGEPGANDAQGDAQVTVIEDARSVDTGANGHNEPNKCGSGLSGNEDEVMDDQVGNSVVDTGANGHNEPNKCGLGLSGNEDVVMDDQVGNSAVDTGANGHNEPNKCGSGLSGNEDVVMDDQVCNSAEIACGNERKEVDSGPSDKDGFDVRDKAHPGALWDVFRRQDVPKLIEYLMVHWKEFPKQTDESVMHPLFDQAVYLNQDHKRRLKEDCGIEPWTFEQHLGEAVFIPSGCPFQARNLQSSVQLALDFLSTESLGESVRVGEEIRCLPTNHKAKLHMLEVGKMSLYAASSATKDVQKLALDPKIGPELGFDDPNLTAMVSDNLEKMIKRRQVACI